MTSGVAGVDVKEFVYLDSRVGSARRPVCLVCEHEMDGHDVISRRYCDASQTNALTRRCICQAVVAAVR